MTLSTSDRTPSRPDELESLQDELEQTDWLAEVDPQRPPRPAPTRRKAPRWAGYTR